MNSERLCYKGSAEPVELKPSNCQRRNFAPINFKVSGKQRTRNKLRFRRWHSNHITSLSSKMFAFMSAWLNDFELKDPVSLVSLGRL